MKNILIVLGGGVIGYGLYTLIKNSKKPCSCSDAKTAVAIAKQSPTPPNNFNQIFPDSVRQEFDASYEAIFPNTNNLGSPPITDDPEAFKQNL